MTDSSATSLVLDKPEAGERALTMPTLKQAFCRTFPSTQYMIAPLAWELLGRMVQSGCRHMLSSQMETRMSNLLTFQLSYRLWSPGVLSPTHELFSVYDSAWFLCYFRIVVLFHF